MGLFCCVSVSGCQNQRQVFFLQPVQNICESGTAIHPAILDAPVVQCGKSSVSYGCFPTDTRLFCCVSASRCQNQRQIFFLQPVQDVPHLRIWNGNASGSTGCPCSAMRKKPCILRMFPNGYRAFLLCICIRMSKSTASLLPATSAKYPTSANLERQYIRRYRMPLRCSTEKILYPADIPNGYRAFLRV